MISVLARSKTSVKYLKTWAATFSCMMRKAWGPASKV